MAFAFALAVLELSETVLVIESTKPSITLRLGVFALEILAIRPEVMKQTTNHRGTESQSFFATFSVSLWFNMESLSASGEIKSIEH